VVAVFLSNVMLQHWTDQGRVRLDDDTVTLLAERRTVTLTPAVRFTKLIDGGGDPHRLLGTVKTRTQLVALGAEHYMDSVILGDVGYTVLEGFRGELSPAPRPATTPAVNAPPSRAVVAPVSVNVTQPPAAAPPRPTTSPRHSVVTARPVTEGDDDAAALSALFLSTVREK
jgi:hypothetical protein